MDVSVLSCPAEFDQVFFVEAHTDCHPVARLRAKDQMAAWWVSGRKEHAGSITDKRGHVEAKGLAFSLIIGGGLGRKSARVEYDHQDEDEPSQAPEMAQDTLKNNFRLVHGVIRSVSRSCILRPHSGWLTTNPLNTHSTPYGCRRAKNELSALRGG
jgi:hypothetical protein